MLEAAEASLKALNKNDVTEVKAMKRPPVGVLLVIEAICIIKKVKPHRVREVLFFKNKCLFGAINSILHGIPILY